jgi:hypothetical protein
MEFHRARDGDHLPTPFECDLCIFRKLFQVEPDPSTHTDPVLLAFIRRLILDAFWSRATGTVRNNRGTVKRNIEDLAKLGRPIGPYYDPGPTPSFDHAGYETALAVLMDTKRAGRYDVSHKQWDASRKVKTAIANFEKLHAHHPLSHLCLLNEENGSTMRFHFGGSSSLWYQRFAQGCKARMGQDIRQNLALSTALWLAFLNKCERNVRKSESFNKGTRWVIVGFFFATEYVLSLRGPEGFMFEISLLKEHRQLSNGLVRLPVLGKLKGDSREETHHLRAVPVTKSGIQVRKWRDMLLRIHEEANREAGPAICDDEGFLLSSAVMSQHLWEVLEEIYDEPDREVPFPIAIGKRSDIRDLINLSRSPRRSSESRATKMDVSPDDKEIVNRWKRKADAKGKQPVEKLRIHYTDQELLDDNFKRYTWAM